jgi:hypothetical protein
MGILDVLVHSMGRLDVGLGGWMPQSINQSPSNTRTSATLRLFGYTYGIAGRFRNGREGFDDSSMLHSQGDRPRPPPWPDADPGQHDRIR